LIFSWAIKVKNRWRGIYLMNVCVVDWENHHLWPLFKSLHWFEKEKCSVIHMVLYLGVVVVISRSDFLFLPSVNKKKGKREKIDRPRERLCNQVV
jgi:hypothetical protein